MNIKNIAILLLFLGLVIACEDMEQVVEIELPPVEKELVIECYLEAGQPYRLLLTETKDYFEDLTACPFVRDAIVVISHNGQQDTLQEATFFNDNCDPNDIVPYGFIPYISPDSTRFYNYGSSTVCPLSYNQPFTVEVWDTANNRFATATTQFRPPVDITTFETSYNNAGKAYCLFGCKDDPAVSNYFRMTMHQTSLTKAGDGAIPLPVQRKPEFDRVVGDEGLFGNNDVLHGTNFKYDQGDTLIGTIYHIEKEYYDYLSSTRDAESTNGSPFGQPGTIKSNVQGGRGVFTFLSYKRDTLIVP